MQDSEIFITGANGQIGTALRQIYPNSKSADIDELNITDKNSVLDFDWTQTKVLINAAGYTNVDGAQTPEGEKTAFAVNDQAVGYLARAAKQNNLTLVHVSTAYVFDGAKKIYTEEDEPNPLGVYAKSKLAGDKKAAATSKHYIVRTDSVIGEGKNFVRTMLELGKKGVPPTVVSDQYIRPAFTTELAQAINHLLTANCPFGIYNLTNEGKPISWADFTRAIFKEANINLKVTDTTLAKYSAGKEGVAPRPLNSVLDLAKIEATGFTPHDWYEDLMDYINKELGR